MGGWGQGGREARGEEKAAVLRRFRGRVGRPGVFIDTVIMREVGGVGARSGRQHLGYVLLIIGMATQFEYS